MICTPDLHRQSPQFYYGSFLHRSRAPTCRVLIYGTMRIPCAQRINMTLEHHPRYHRVYGCPILSYYCCICAYSASHKADATIIIASLARGPSPTNLEPSRCGTDSLTKTLIRPKSGHRLNPLTYSTISILAPVVFRLRNSVLVMLRLSTVCERVRSLCRLPSHSQGQRMVME